MVPKFKVPDRRTLGQQVDTELSHLQETIAKYLGGSKYYYSFGVDISTTKGSLFRLNSIGLWGTLRDDAFSHRHHSTRLRGERLLRTRIRLGARRDGGASHSGLRQAVV